MLCVMCRRRRCFAMAWRRNMACVLAMLCPQALRRDFPGVPIMALTATAAAKVSKAISWPSVCITCTVLRVPGDPLSRIRARATPRPLTVPGGARARGKHK